MSITTPKPETLGIPELAASLFIMYIIYIYIYMLAYESH